MAERHKNNHYVKHTTHYYFTHEEWKQLGFGFKSESETLCGQTFTELSEGIKAGSTLHKVTKNPHDVTCSACITAVGMEMIHQPRAMAWALGFRLERKK